MTEKISYIPARLKSAAKGGFVTGAEDVMDDRLGMSQERVNEALENGINALDSQGYEHAEATEQTTDVTDLLPVTGEKNKLYQVAFWDGEQYNTNAYAQYTWDGEQYKLMSVKNPGIDTKPSSSNANLISGAGIFNENKNSAKGFSIDYSHNVSINQGQISYVTSSVNDCFWIPIPKNAIRVTLNNVVIGGNYRYFSSTTPSTESYIGYDQDGYVPNNAALALVNVRKSDNADYNNANIVVRYITEFIQTTINNALFPEGHFVDNNHVVSGSGTWETATYKNNSSYDCIWVLVKDGAKKINLTGATVRGYYYFDTLNPIGKSPIAYNTSGGVVSGVKLCLINAAKEDNVGGYDNLVVTQDYNYVTNRISATKAADEASKDFVILPRKAISVNSGSESVSIIDMSSRDCAFIYLKPYTSFISLENVVLASGTYFFFSDTDVSFENLLGSTTGSVIEGAMLAVVNIDLSNSANDYYKNVDLKYQYNAIAASELNNIQMSAREKHYSLLEPDEIIEHARCYKGDIQESSALDLYVYNIDPLKRYCFSGSYSAGVAGIYYIAYFDDEDNFITYDSYYGKNTSFSKALLNVPASAAKIKMNVYRNYSSSFNLSEVILGDYYDMDAILSTVNSIAPLKVVVAADKTFYVRHKIDDDHDGILTFKYYTAYGLSYNCIMQSAYYVGLNTESDTDIMSKSEYQTCRDSQSPVFTDNFGPMYSNHGYAIPRVVIPEHGLDDNDLGTEWYDQLDRHYKIGRINGSSLYLLPVIDTSGGRGYEMPSWRYSQTMPTQITKVGTGTTLNVESAYRYDYQVSQLRNTRVIINGKEVGEGTYICSEVELAYEQLGYNPLDVQVWYPTPEYGGLMLTMDRHFTVTGSKGFLSLTSNTVLNNLYPYPLHHYIDVVPQLPFKIGDYDAHVYIPKMNKHDTDIDFRAEFISNDDTHPAVRYYRNSDDIVDVNDIPDRAYCYLKNENDEILYGCAGGHSLVRGMSVKSIRNNYIAIGNSTNKLAEIGIWNPPAGNKHYNNIIAMTKAMYDDPTSPDAVANHVPDTFINEFEGYMCWYKPQNDIQTFFHRSKEGYVVYIHTNKTIDKGYAVLPDFMNNLAVDSIIEQTNGIALKTNTVIDGKIFFTSDNSQIEYNYLVVRLR